MKRNSPSLRRGFQLLYWEGAIALVYEVWVGPTYLSGLAGELGVSVHLVSIFAAATWIGAVGQLFGVWAFTSARSVKRYTLLVTIASRCFWCLPLVLALYWGWRAQSAGLPFPTQTWFYFTAATAYLSATLSALGIAGWNSWMKDLVPERFRGRFFGIRQRFTMAALISANLLAAALVGWKSAGNNLGYLALGALGLVAATVSTVVLAKVPDAMAQAGDAHPVSGFSFAILLEPLRDRSFRRLLVFGALFNGAIQLASPFFPYYFTKELLIPMSAIALWNVLTNVGALLAAGALGSYIDRSGNPKRLLWIATHLMALSPLAYVAGSASWVRAIAPFEFLINGAAWSGYSLAMTMLLFRACPERRNLIYFSVFAAVSGVAGAAANFLGGELAGWLAPWGGFRALWVVTALARLLVLWIVLRRYSENNASAGPALRDEPAQT